MAQDSEREEEVERGIGKTTEGVVVHSVTDQTVTESPRLKPLRHVEIVQDMDLAMPHARQNCPGPGPTAGSKLHNDRRVVEARLNCNLEEPTVRASDQLLVMAPEPVGPPAKNVPTVVAVGEDNLQVLFRTHRASRKYAGST